MLETWSQSDVLALVLVGKLLEPLWGAVEMVVFLSVVNVGVAIAAAFSYYVLYTFTYQAAFGTDYLVTHGHKVIFSVLHAHPRPERLPVGGGSGRQADHARLRAGPCRPAGQGDQQELAFEPLHAGRYSVGIEPGARLILRHFRLGIGHRLDVLEVLSGKFGLIIDLISHFN